MVDFGYSLIVDPGGNELLRRAANCDVESHSRLVVNPGEASYESAGCDWNDSKYMELGEFLSEVERALSTSSVEITNLITKLQVMDNYLKIIDDMKF